MTEISSILMINCLKSAKIANLLGSAHGEIHGNYLFEGPVEPSNIRFHQNLIFETELQKFTHN